MANNPNDKQSLSTQAYDIYLRTLKLAWMSWFMLRFVLLPVVMVVVTNVSALGVVAWQMVVMMPALLATPFVWRAKSSYALIVVSLVMMVYWAAAASFWLIYAYEQASFWVVVVYALETVLLSAVFVCLFMVLKKMPAMHKSRRTS